MPIRREFRKFYGPAWRQVRKRIIARSRNSCEQCGVKNHAEVDRCNGGWWREIRFPGGLQDPEIRWRNEHGEYVEIRKGRRHKPRIRRVRICLTVAHLNHTPGDDRDENLRAWCQWCHLNNDKEHHRETRTVRKDAGRPLLAQATA